MRFLSVEPLLEDLGALDLRGIHWVIVGGESGPDFRPMDHAWARGVRDQSSPQACRSSSSNPPRGGPRSARESIEADGTRTTWRQYPGELAPLPNQAPAQLPLGLTRKG